MVLGKSYGLLLKSMGKSQKDVAESTGVSTVQISRFINDKSGISAASLSSLLDEVGIDLQDIIMKKVNDDNFPSPSSEDECVLWMLKKMDRTGKHTYIRSLAWAFKASQKEKLPKNMQVFMNKTLKV